MNPGCTGPLYVRAYQGKTAPSSDLAPLPHPRPQTRTARSGVLRLDVHNGNGCCAADAKWAAVETRKRLQRKDPVYQSMTAVQLEEALPFRIISLARSTDRRAAMVKRLEAAGACAHPYCLLAHMMLTGDQPAITPHPGTPPVAWHC
jgi:hypothetical protein